MDLIERLWVNAFGHNNLVTISSQEEAFLRKRAGEATYWKAEYFQALHELQKSNKAAARLSATAKTRRYMLEDLKEAAGTDKPSLAPLFHNGQQIEKLSSTTQHVVPGPAETMHALSTNKMAVPLGP